MTRQPEQPSAPVPRRARTIPAEEVRSRWRWAEPSVWTERMLTALEQGVQGGTWHSLSDKVYKPANLAAACQKVLANAGAAGVDHVSAEAFAHRAAEELARLEEVLRRGDYQPQAVRRVRIPKPGGGERPLGVPTVRDRIVQTAVRQVLEPIFEREFAEHSYGFRPGRGCKDALRRVDTLLKAGYTHVVDADLKSFFDTIPHDRLMQLVRGKVSDSRLLALLEKLLAQGILEGLEAWTPEEGCPQGSCLSPLLANIYLNPLDHLLAAAGLEMVRYADDFVILCRSRAEAEQGLALVRAWVAEAGLSLHPDKTQIADAATEGFEFLGYRFQGGRRFVRRKSQQKLKDALRAKTGRTNGNSLSQIVADVNRTLVGWFNYFQHSFYTPLRDLDKWLRMRLRSILRKRCGSRGRGRGADHQRWPNAYFANLGLFSLEQSHALLRQSSKR